MEAEVSKKRDLFNKMAYEEFGGAYSESQFRRENPMLNDFGVAEHMWVDTFRGNKDRLNRSLWVRVRDSRAVSAVMVLGTLAALGLPMVLLMHAYQESPPLWVALVSMASGTAAFVGAVLVGCHRGNTVVPRREAQLSATGVSLYRRILHWAGRFEVHATSDAFLPEVKDLVAAFQEVATREFTIRSAQEQLLRSEGVGGDYRSAVGLNRSSKRLSEAGLRTFGVMEENRVTLAQEMRRLVEVVKGVALDAEEDAHEAALVAQQAAEVSPEVTVRIPLQEIPVVSTGLLEALLAEKAEGRRLRETIRATSSAGRLRE